MDDTDIAEGDELFLYMKLNNPETAAAHCDAYILLEVYGSYFCWPSWSDININLDCRDFVIPGNGSMEEEVIRFIWPAVNGSVSNLHFFGAAFDYETFDLFGEVQVIEWGYR